MGFQPKVLLAVGELFVRARSARSQALSACVIARRRRVSIRPKAEGFARRRRAHCSAKPQALAAKPLVPIYNITYYDLGLKNFEEVIRRPMSDMSDFLHLRWSVQGICSLKLEILPCCQ